jgi:hypothetical protein
MEDKEESIEGKKKMVDYVRWIFVTVFGLILLATLVAAIYRKFLE